MFIHGEGSGWLAADEPNKVPVRVCVLSILLYFYLGGKDAHRVRGRLQIFLMTPAGKERGWRCPSACTQFWRTKRAAAVGWVSGIVESIAKTWY